MTRSRSREAAAVRPRARRGRAPVRAVERLSFDIAPGQTLGLVGQSGSGKTTAGRAILQLQKAQEGSVRRLGQELTTMPAGELRRMRRHMQFVLQKERQEAERKRGHESERFFHEVGFPTYRYILHAITILAGAQAPETTALRSGRWPTVLP